MATDYIASITANRRYVEIEIHDESLRAVAMLTATEARELMNQMEFALQLVRDEA